MDEPEHHASAHEEEEHEGYLDAHVTLDNTSSQMGQWGVWVVPNIKRPSGCSEGLGNQAVAWQTGPPLHCECARPSGVLACTARSGKPQGHRLFSSLAWQTLTWINCCTASCIVLRSSCIHTPVASCQHAVAVRACHARLAAPRLCGSGHGALLPRGANQQLRQPCAGHARLQGHSPTGSPRLPAHPCRGPLVQAVELNDAVVRDA
jgi:hypothetical protein